ncbi:MAG: hypothetical protein ACO32I_08840, partial [Candidatus Limnocylindrus sp.]
MFAPINFDVRAFFNQTADYSPEQLEILRMHALGMAPQGPQQAQANGPDANVQVNQGAGPSTDEPQPYMDVEQQAQEQRVQFDEPEVLQDDQDVAGAQDLMRADQLNISYGNDALGIASTTVSAVLGGSAADALAADKGQGVNIASRESVTDAGAPPAHNDINLHFEDSFKQCWPHHDLYDVSGQRFITEEIDDAEAERYKQRYGASQNLFIRSVEPKKITGVEVNYGMAKDDILDRLITDPHPVCRRNLYRILAIYYDEQPIGRLGQVTITHAEKVDGFLRGVWQPPQTMQNYRPPVYRRVNNQHTRLWQPVFTRRPPDEMRPMFIVDEWIHEERDLLDD